MARLIKLSRALKFDDPSKDKEIYINPESVQYLIADVCNIVEIAMNGTIVRVRGELDEIAAIISSNNNRRIY